MLTLSMKQPQGYPFGASNRPSSGSASSSQATSATKCPPQNMNTPMMPRRSMAPPQCSKRPKLSLQTSILPQPVSPALPLTCSADTPTSRNTLANSFRSPVSSVDKSSEKFQDVKDSAQCPYGLESIRRGILKNTPLAKLIRTRREERDRKKAYQSKTRISFVNEPEVIPRPPEDAEMESIVEDVEVDITPAQAQARARSDVCSATSPSSPANHEPKGIRPRSDSGEWHRLRAQRSVNEGRELRSVRETGDSCTSSILSTAKHLNTARLEPHSPLSGRDASPNHPPQTPETPSPLRTRRWVWTLGDDFNSASADPNSEDGSRDVTDGDTRSSSTAEGGAGTEEEDDDFDPKRTRRLVRVPTGFRPRMGSDSHESVSATTQPETPSTTTTTPMTPLSSRTAASSVPESPATPRSVTAESAAPSVSLKAPLRINVPIRASATTAASENNTQQVPMTPRSVPLPETPRV